MELIFYSLYCHKYPPALRRSPLQHFAIPEVPVKPTYSAASVKEGNSFSLFPFISY